MATAYTTPTFVVVRASLRQQAEDAAKAADPESGAGTFIPGVPLREVGDTTNTVVAYWCRWQMTPAQRDAIASRTGTVPLTVDKTPNRSHSAWLFDATDGQWTPQGVLDVLGFDTLATVGGP